MLYDYFYISRYITEGLKNSLIILFLIWNRLFRIRLPRYYPYILNEFSLIALLLLCLGLAFGIIILLFKITLKNNWLSALLDKSFTNLQHYISRKSSLASPIERIQRKVLKFLSPTLHYIQYLHIFSKAIIISMCIYYLWKFL